MRSEISDTVGDLLGKLVSSTIRYRRYDAERIFLMEPEMDAWTHCMQKWRRRSEVK